MLKLLKARCFLFHILSSASMFCSGAAYAQTSPEDLDWRVMGGALAAQGAWPWQVAIYKRIPSNEFQFHCGGTLIHQKWVLSAAHCIRDGIASDFLIVEGTNRIDFPIWKSNGHGQTIKVERVVLHEQFKRETLENDIGLLELSSAARSAPVLLATSSDHALEIPQRTGIVSGWGMLRGMRMEGRQAFDVETNKPIQAQDFNRYLTDRLMEAAITLVDLDTCRQLNTDLPTRIDHRNLCAGVKDGRRDACKGDSGGPLHGSNDNKRYFQIGIVSWGKGCGLPERYSIYTRVAAFEEWIQSRTGVKSPRPSKPAGPEVAEIPPQSTTVVQAVLRQSNPAGVTVELVGGDALKVGGSAQFKVTTKKPGHLLLIDVTPDGKMTQIFPNARSLSTPTGAQMTSNLVTPDRPLLVPDRRNPYVGFDWTVEPPTGPGLLVAVLSEQPLRSVPIPDTPKTMEKSAAIDFVSSLAQELQRDLVVEGLPRPPVWSLAMKPYRIER